MLVYLCLLFDSMILDLLVMWCMFVLRFLNLVHVVLNFFYTHTWWFYIGMWDYCDFMFLYFFILFSFKLQDFVLICLILLPFLVIDCLCLTLWHWKLLDFPNRSLSSVVSAFPIKKQCFTIGYEESIWSNCQRPVRIWTYLWLYVLSCQSNLFFIKVALCYLFIQLLVAREGSTRKCLKYLE